MRKELAKRSLATFRRRVLAAWGTWRGIWAILLGACLLLTGCVRYDVQISFESQTRGEIVQHIQIGERLSAFSSETSEAWLDSIERRARRLRGKTKRISDQEIVVKIPFNNGAELADKFNRFLNPPESNKSKDAALESSLPEIASSMKVTQNNWLLLLRNRLSYDLDLRSLGVIAADGNVAIAPGALVDLEFALSTPWGARIVEPEASSALEREQGWIALAPEVEDGGRTLVFSLQPGQLNHLEVVFWVPSFIGIGTLAIVLFVTAGIYLRYNLLPAPAIGDRLDSNLQATSDG